MKLTVHTVRIMRRLAAVLVAVLIVPLALTGCSLMPKDTIRVLAGSEVKDLEPILKDMVNETGVQLEFEYMGTLDGTEALLVQQAGGEHKWDAIWFPSNRYLSLFTEGQNAITKSESIMRSDVVLGLKQDVAEQLGWSDGQASWEEIVAAAGSGKLRYGMASPIASNSGFTTLVQLSTALSGTGTVLTTGDIPKVTPQLTEFARGQQLTSGSSGWLADNWLAHPDKVDGIFNYDSVLQGLVTDSKPLTIIRPSDGTIASDYPLSLIAGADQGMTERFDKVTEYLLRADTQERITQLTRRAPAAGGAQQADGSPVFQLPFPNQLDTVQTLLNTWISSVKKPSNMVFAIDTSGSMGDGDRMTQLRDALNVLSGDHGEGTASFLRLQPRERITYLEFSGAIKSDATVDIPSDDAGYQQALAQINQVTSGYQPGGWTAIFDTVETAYERALTSADGDHISSIVVFTDGANTDGHSIADFEEWHAEFVAAHPEAKDIPTHAIVFGDSNREELDRLAAATGGRTFSVDESSLTSVFREIRGYL